MRFTFLFASVALGGCAYHTTTGALVNQLRTQSMREGLAIVVVDGGSLLVRPFDAAELVVPTLHNSSDLTVGPDGRTLVWVQFCDALNGHEVRAETSARRLISVLKLPCDERLRVGAISLDRGRVALVTWKVNRGKLLDVSLAVWELNTRILKAIRPVNSIDTVMTWSPDGAYLAYSDLNQVSIYNLSNGTIHPVGNGSDPAWSPDGRLISYRISGGDIAILEVASGVTRQMGRGLGRSGAIHWSPNSRFLLFSEPAPWYLHIPLLGRRSP